MSTASRYWRFVRIDGTGKAETRPIEELRRFFHQQFPEVSEKEEVPHAKIQHRLLNLFQGVGDVSHATTSHLAGWCLRCFISHQIKQVCAYLAAQFGSTHGFTRDDLLSCVLNDELNPPQRAMQTPFVSLGMEILQTFDPSRGSLETWTNRLVKHNSELNAFLLEHGVYLVSDWAILNDTKPKQLERIFSQFHCLSTVQIKQAVLLLESYHAVYRRDRLSALESGCMGPCPPPTVYQMHQMADYILKQPPIQELEVNRQGLAPEVTLAQLQNIAELLRRYRIHVRGGQLNRDSLTDPEVNRQAESIQSCNANNDEDEQTEFLKSYLQEFNTALERAIERVMIARSTKLERKGSQKVEQFIQALGMFHCQGRAMGEIASEIGLQAQYQVTRLLNLKQLRADMRRHMLNFLYGSVANLAKDYADPERLHNLDRQLEAILSEQVEKVMYEAEAEGSHARGHPLHSQFAQKLCEYLRRTYNNC